MDNPNNKLITKEEIENILNYFGNIGDNGERLCVDNLEPFQRAFIHESYYQSVQNSILNNLVQQNNTYLSLIPTESNERLEFLGDHILKAIAGRYLFERFDEEREGFLTKLKIKIEKCTMLHKIGVTLGFKKHLLLSLQVENQTILDIDRGRNCPSYYEDAFEAFIGAIVVHFQDKGYTFAERFVKFVIENIIDFAQIISVNDNHKDSLQRYFQSRQKWKTPVYVSLNEEGPLYRKVFTRMLTISQQQLDELDESIQKKVKCYTHSVLAEYKQCSNDIFLKLLSLQETGKFVLGIGFGRKVTAAEQDCAKTCLNNLDIDLNY
jgi:dsRNA-specific ribonuclease